MIKNTVLNEKRKACVNCEKQILADLNFNVVTQDILTWHADSVEGLDNSHIVSVHLL